MNIPTGFKDRLANELSAVAHATPAAPATPTLGRCRRAPLMAAGVAAAAAAVILPSVSGSGATPAHAVSEENDGSVLVHLNRPEGLPGLQKQLKALGIRAVALKADDNCPTKYPFAAYATAKPTLTYPSDPGKVRIYPNRIPDGTGDILESLPTSESRPATLLLVAEFRKDGTVRTMTPWLVKDVPSCSLPGTGDQDWILPPAGARDSSLRKPHRSSTGKGLLPRHRTGGNQPVIFDPSLVVRVRARFPRLAMPS
ncbi:hypothetical protein [Streptomyces coelicoflavus]|uniref:hypothetical protein n=1 Tax=Streptomyces coelicoflavus TaxID=285562 RepID=UPI003F4A716D